MALASVFVSIFPVWISKRGNQYLEVYLFAVQLQSRPSFLLAVGSLRHTYPVFLTVFFPRPPACPYLQMAHAAQMGAVTVVAAHWRHLHASVSASTEYK